MFGQHATPSGAVSARHVASRPGVSLTDRFLDTRSLTGRLVRPLSAEDAAIQSMPSCSPAKWHLAHTTWFFETFLLQPHASDWRTPVPEFGVLFNSYYNGVGPQFPRHCRGLLTRPTFEEVLLYREAVDDAVAALLARDAGEPGPETASIVELGIQHEQQHQELLLSDIKHLLSCNPLRPAYEPPRWRTDAPAPVRGHSAPGPANWLPIAGGVRTIGAEFDPLGARFVYDNESPRHEVLLRPFEIADRAVTNADWLEFIDDGGYDRSELWLDAGWTFVREHGVGAPLYWRREADAWREYTLAGERPLDPASPVVHVSFYEAEAFARWAEARLPTEAEWEVAASEHAAGEPRGVLLESGALHPLPAAPAAARSEDRSDEGPGGDTPASPMRQAFGDVWEWTRSDYGPYPGYRPPPGAVGEYNGKFMSGQYVLRGGCCATPASHIRATYRNFYPPDSRWCFAGLRLARDA